MITPDVATSVRRTYAVLTEDVGPPTLDNELGPFLLALDMNGQGRFATWVQNMVGLARSARGDAYAHGWLDMFAGPVLGMGLSGAS